MEVQLPYRSTGTTFASRALRWSPHIGISLFFVFILIRLPFLSQYPANWDSVQYLLGVDAFDVQSHQPHPPGYIGYIGLGRIAEFIFGDAHLGLVMISVLSGAVATAAMYRLSRYWLSRQYALIAAILFGTSPLVWYYSEVALNYIIEAAVVIPIAWMCYRARMEKSWRDLLLATLLLSLLGALRQSGLVLLAPLWLYTAWAFPWRERIASGAVLGVTTLAWLVPLLWLAGGPMTYWRESRALGALVSGEPTVLSKLQEHSGYLAQVLLAFAIGLTAALVVLIVHRTVARDVVRDLSTHERWFFLLWAIPSLATFVFGHFGQLGYVLPILPIAFLWVGAVLARIGTQMTRLRTAAPASMAIIIVAVNTLVFIAVPDIVVWVTQGNAIGEFSKAPVSVRQYDIETNDAYWDEVIDGVRKLPEDSTAVLTTIGGPRVSGGYRHLSYYLPEYEIYGLGRDQQGVFGQLFQTTNGESDYSVAGLHHARRVVSFPEHIRYVVTPEKEVIEQIPDSLSPVKLAGSDLVVIRWPEGMNLAFLPGEQLVACRCADMMLTANLAIHHPPARDVSGS